MQNRWFEPRTKDRCLRSGEFVFVKRFLAVGQLTCENTMIYYILRMISHTLSLLDRFSKELVCCIFWGGGNHLHPFCEFSGFLKETKTPRSGFVFFVKFFGRQEFDHFCNFTGCAIGSLVPVGCWLAVGIWYSTMVVVSNIYFFLSLFGEDSNFWLIFFRWVETTNWSTC